AIFDSSGDLAGLWDGDSVVASDILKEICSNFLANQGRMLRPQFGFHYRAVSEAEALVFQVPAGVKVLDVASGGAAQKAGLLPGDIIRSWNGNNVDGSAALEALLAASKPGDQ